MFPRTLAMRASKVVSSLSSDGDGGGAWTPRRGPRDLDLERRPSPPDAVEDDEDAVEEDAVEDDEDAVEEDADAASISVFTPFSSLLTFSW